MNDTPSIGDRIAAEFSEDKCYLADAEHRRLASMIDAAMPLDRQLAEATKRMRRVQAAYPGSRIHIDTSTYLAGAGAVEYCHWRITVHLPGGRLVASGGNSVYRATAAEAVADIERQLIADEAAAYPEAVAPIRAK